MITFIINYIIYGIIFVIAHTLITKPQMFTSLFPTLFTTAHGWSTILVWPVTLYNWIVSLINKK